MTKLTSPPTEIPPGTEGGSCCLRSSTKGETKTLLVFMPETPDHRLSDVASLIGGRSPVPPVPWSGHERRSTHAVKTPLGRAQILGRLGVPSAECVTDNGTRTPARHPLGRRVSLANLSDGRRRRRCARPCGSLAFSRGAVNPQPWPRTAERPCKHAWGRRRRVLGLPSATTGTTLPAWSLRSTDYRGAMVFRSEPAGARVFVNGQQVGSYAPRSEQPLGGLPGRSLSRLRDINCGRPPFGWSRTSRRASSCALTQNYHASDQEASGQLHADHRITKRCHPRHRHLPVQDSSKLKCSVCSGPPPRMEGVESNL